LKKSIGSGIEFKTKLEQAAEMIAEIAGAFGNAPILAVMDSWFGNRVAGGFNPPAPTTPRMRVRTGRFTKITGP